MIDADTGHPHSAGGGTGLGEGSDGIHMYLLAALFKYTSALELARARLGEPTKAVGNAGSLPRRIETAASHRGSTTNVAFRGHGGRACGGAGVHSTAPGGYRRG